MARDLTIPASIVFGCALIGGGLFFGLRSQTQPAQPTASSSSSSSALQTAPSSTPTTQPLPPQPAQAAPAPNVDPAAQKQAEADAIKAIAGLKTTWTKSCWESALKTKAEPKTSTYRLNLALTPEGKLVGIGWSEVREAPSRPDVAQCLRQERFTFSVSPPGSSLSLDIPVEFP